MEHKIEIKGSKSVINRLLCMALYHDIDLIIKNINLCDDVYEMLNIFLKIGKTYTIQGD